MSTPKDSNQVLSEITGALVGQLNLKELLTEVVELTMKLLEADVCSVFLEDRESNPGIIKMLAGSGFAKPLVNIAEYKTDEGFTGHVYKSGRKFNIKSPLALRDLRNSQTGERIWAGKHDYQQWPKGMYGFRNLIALPLTIKNQILGVIKVENKRQEKEHFSDNDERVFETIANVVALAIENARLHDKIETQLKSISAKAAHRMYNHTTHYDGIELSLDEELANDYLNKNKLHAIRDRLERVTKDLKEMVGEFKSYGRPINLNKMPTNLNKIIQDEIWIAHPPSNIKINVYLDEKMPSEILVDGNKLAESLKELIVNSLKAIKNENKGEGNICITTKYDGKNAIIRIEDDGPGFPHNFPIFVPFSTTDPNGTGLGLATVKELIEKHGGRINASSELKSSLGGAMISLEIPIKGD